MSTSNRFGIVLARSGSKRLMDKNFRMFANSSLWQIAMRFAEEAGLIPVLSSDNTEALYQAEQKGWTPVLRSKVNSGDETTSEDSLRFTVAALGIPKDSDLVLLQPTSPLRSQSSFRQGDQIWRDNNPDFGTVLMSVTEDNSEYWIGDDQFDRKRIGRISKNFQRTSETREKIYRENGNFYFLKAGFLDSNEFLTDSSVWNFSTPPSEDCDIDTEENFCLAEILFNAIYSKEYFR